MTRAPACRGACSLPQQALAAACLLLAAALLACTTGGDDPDGEARLAELEAQTAALEESLEALAEQNARLEREVAALRAELAARDSTPGTPTGDRLDDLDARLQAIEEIFARLDALLPGWERWTEDDDRESARPDDAAVERTVRLVKDSGAQVRYVDHPGRGDRSVLAIPRSIMAGETPLIVSLHGFGSDSASQAAYIPLHERVNTRGFALLLPNGTHDDMGNRFWNPTDECCDGGKSGEDDIAYLTELVAEARSIVGSGAVYIFGYSNGGFMSHHLACKGLPALRAVASLAGTSYVEDSSCAGAPPVSVLHIHGTADAVILFEGDESDRDPDGDGKRAFYLGATDMVTRWGQLAGCEWPEDLEPHASLDLDRRVPGPETRAFRVASGCAEGVTIELWEGVGSSHGPAYGDAFVDALLDWLLSRE